MRLAITKKHKITAVVGGGGGGLVCNILPS